MKRKIKKGLSAATVSVFLTIFSLAFFPHYTCACGEFEDGSYLTHAVNTVSEKFFGKPIIPKNKNPYR